MHAKTLIWGLAIALVTGCASGKTKGQKQVAELTDRINSFVAELEATQKTLSDTMAAHDAIVHNKDGDLVKPFGNFSDGLDGLDSQAKDLRERREKFDAAAEVYFAEWKAKAAQFNSEDMKKRSMDRLETTRARFKKLDNAGKEIRGKADPLMATLKDHRTYWSSDLNKESAASLAKDDAKVQKQAKEVSDLIQRLIDAGKAYNKSVAMRQDPPPPGEGDGDAEKK